MAAGTGSADRATAQWETSHRKWTQGPLRLIVPTIVLVYLLFVADAVGKYSHGASAVAGDVIIAAFALCWLAVMTLIAQGTSAFAVPVTQLASRRFWTLYCLLAVLFVAELPFARAEAFVLCVYITMLTVPVLGGWSAPIVAALALAALVVPAAIPSWHDSIAAAFDNLTPIGIPVVGLAVFAQVKVQRANIAIAEARARLGVLTAENERLRIARDLHDLLGRSLTTITVKASLARRLSEAEPAKALTEIADVEVLARQSLANVRAAITRYRDVTLEGELTAGGDLLRAAGISANLPDSIDIVDPAHQELFGWVVREGLTNVVRHSRASTCTVRLTRDSVEITDNGMGMAAPAGSGLSGLRERAAAVGGVLEAGPRRSGGWRLRVGLPPRQGM